MSSSPNRANRFRIECFVNFLGKVLAPTKIKAFSKGSDTSDPWWNFAVKQPARSWSWFQLCFLFPKNYLGSGFKLSYLGKWSNLTNNIFGMGWNHQLVIQSILWVFLVRSHPKLPVFLRQGSTRDHHSMPPILRGESTQSWCIQMQVIFRDFRKQKSAVFGLFIIIWPMQGLQCIISFCAEIFKQQTYQPDEGLEC